MNDIVDFTILYGLVPFILFLIYRNKLSYEIIYILPFIALTFFASVYELVFTSLLQISIKYFFITYCVFSFFTISYFFSKVLVNFSKIYFRVSYFIFFCVFLFVVFNWTSYGAIVLSSFLDIFQTSFILFFSIVWLRKVFKDLQYNNLFESIYFYFISGLIIYYCGTLFLFLLSDIIYKDDKSILQYYWLLNVILNLILRSILIICIWKARVK